jgi:hypothetical protein
MSGESTEKDQAVRLIVQVLKADSEHPQPVEMKAKLAK